MKTFLHVAKIHVPYDDRAQHKHNLKALKILHLHAVQIRLVERHLLETLEDGNRNVGLLALLAGAVAARRLAG